MSETAGEMAVQTINELAAALAKAQASFDQIKRSKTVEVKTEKGRYTFSYAPLEEIIRATRKHLSDNGIAITQDIVTDESGRWVETTLIHSSGQSKSCRYPIVAGRDQGPQGMASSVSYSRRYGWVLATGVVADDDDDGNISEGNDVKTVAEKVAKANIQPASGVMESLESKEKAEAQRIASLVVDAWIAGEEETARKNWAENKTKLSADGQVASWNLIPSHIRSALKNMDKKAKGGVMDWVLVIYIYAGILAKGDSVALTTIPGFSSEQQCRSAGDKTIPLVSNSTKDLRFICMQRGK